MRQRNDTTAAWTFAATDESGPRTVAPGETTDHPTLLDGWSPADEPATTPGEASDPTPKARARKTTDTDDSKGGEPR
ncbi:hypothetical protein [Streptomyces triculaminicus]|uniref:hypothetical protein n=1 Tax=Streptomyces triculaminicus TaxID=2816232 RepID=UPI00378C7510